MTDWQPPEGEKAHIVCAACRLGDFIAAGPRHFDNIMRPQIKAYLGGEFAIMTSPWDQGFLDQWGRFYTRTEAMEIVKENGQPFDIDRNGGQDTELYSEGLY